MTSPAQPPVRSPDTPSFVLGFAAWLAGLSAAFLNLLNFHGYPLLRAECAIVIVAIVAIAATVSGIRVGTGRLIGSAIAGLFLAVVIDLSVTIDLAWFYALWGLLAVAIWFAEGAVMKLTIASFGAVVAFQLVALTTGIGAPDRPDNAAARLQDAARPAADRPAIVHLMLDSYLGLDAMALGPEYFSTLRAEQSAFFTGNGFQVYPRAYSRHVKTVNSLPALLSYGTAPLTSHGVNVQYVEADELPYFVDLDARGYRTSVVQPTYLDMCVNQPLTHCRKFERSALTSMLETTLTASERATVMGMTLLQLAELPSRFAEAVQLRINAVFGTTGRRPYNRAKLLPLASVREFDRINADLTTLQRGEARIVHLLMPHDPYILDAQCRVRPEADWLDEHGPGDPAAREAAYADQVRCVQRKLAAMLAALDATPAGREAIVLVHGDHGSRITPIVPYIGGPELSERELLMSHSALFAIRVPGEAGGEIAGTFALDELMADFRTRDFMSAPRPAQTEPAVLIMNARSAPDQRRPLPDFGPSVNQL